MANIVEILIRAREEVSKALGRVSASVRSAGAAATKAGGPLGALSGRFNALGQSLGQVSPVLGNFFRLLTNPLLLATAAIAGLIFGLKRMVTSTADTLDELAKMSLRVGVAVEDLSAFRLAAELAGTNIGQVGEALRFLNKNIFDAQKGTGIAKDVFIDFGIAIENVGKGSKGTIDVFLEVADVVSKIEDSGRAAAVAGKLLGERYGPQLVPLLRQGSAGLAEIIKQAERMGLVITATSAKAAERFNDSLTALKFTFEGLKFSIATGLLEPLALLIEGFAELILTIRDGTGVIGTFFGILGRGIVETRKLLAPTALEKITAEQKRLFQALQSNERLLASLREVPPRGPEGRLRIQELEFANLLIREQIDILKGQALALGGVKEALRKFAEEAENRLALLEFEALKGQIEAIGGAANVFVALAAKIKSVGLAIEKAAKISEDQTKKLETALESARKTATAGLLEQIQLLTLTAQGKKEEAIQLKFEIDSRKAAAAATEEQRKALQGLAVATRDAALKGVKPTEEKAGRAADISTRIQILRLQLEGVGATKEETIVVKLKIIDIREELALQALILKAKKEKRDITAQEREELRLTFEVQREQVTVGEKLVAEAKSQQEVLVQVTADTISAMRQTLGDFFNRFFTGELRTAEELWVNFWNSLVRIASDATAQILLDAVLNIGKTSQVLQGGTRGGGGGGGGFLNTIARFFGFGGPTALQLSGPFQEGAVIRRPTLALIGEAGDELVVPLTRKPKPEVARALAAIATPMQEGGIVGTTLSRLERGSDIVSPFPTDLREDQGEEGGVTIINLFDRRQLDAIIASSLADKKGVFVNEIVQGMRGNSVTRRTIRKFGP